MTNSVGAVGAGQVVAQASFPVLNLALREKLAILIVEQRDKIIGERAIKIADWMSAIRTFQVSWKLIEHTAHKNKKFDEIREFAPSGTAAPAEREGQSGRQPN